MIFIDKRKRNHEREIMKMNMIVLIDIVMWHRDKI